MPESAHTIHSQALQNERPLWVRPPRDPASAQHLTIFLDAELYRGHVGVDAVLATLGERLADSWFVFVSMHSVEVRARECPCHPPFAQFVVGELLPWLEEHFPALKHARHRMLVGLSYTGLAASFIALEHPGVFQKVISQSGSYWWNNCWLVEQFDRLPTPIPTAFHLDVGSRETQENVQHAIGVLQVVSQIDGVQRFRDTLLRRGHAVEFTEFDGHHDAAEWKKSLPSALTWALPRS